MGCCKCSCTKKLEHVDRVIHDYDPQENFLNYNVTTIWINRKTKRAWLLVSKEGGIAVWQPIPFEQSAIDKIILNCGNTTPNEKGEIIHRGQCGARTVDDDCKDFCITVNTDWGLQGGKKVCAEESITLSIDKENTNLVTSSSDDVKDGDSIVYDGTNGKVIKKADQWRIGDTENSWTGQFDPETKNLNIFPDDKASDPILTIIPSGVILTNYPTQCSAKLNKTPTFPPNADFETGSNLPFIKIRDEDGYNKNANNFFPGDGQGNYAYYIAPYTGRYFIKYQFLIAYGTGNPPPYYAKVFWGQNPEYSTFIRDVFNSTDNKTISDSGILFLNKGDKVHINIQVKGGSPFINVISTDPNAIENYWEIVFLG